MYSSTVHSMGMVSHDEIVAVNSSEMSRVPEAVAGGVGVVTGVPEKKEKPLAEVDIGVADAEEMALELDEIEVKRGVDAENEAEVKAELVGEDGNKDVPKEGTIVLAASVGEVPTEEVTAV